MGLASFNRMRLRRIEEMKPENIAKEKVEEQVVEAVPETVEAVPEVTEEKVEKTEATRGSKRKSK